MTSYHKNLVGSLIIIIIACIGGYLLARSSIDTASVELDPTPYSVTLSGTYVCLPHLDTKGPQTEECAFGLQTDDGVYYAVNFGASADAMNQFQTRAHITAEGFVVIKEALSSDQWAKYNMKGIFTITKMIESSSVPVSGRLNIDAVCGSALAYMTFPDAARADAFVAECKEGKHPEVIERYKKDMNLGDNPLI
ncbi:MAG: hypothetical protein V4665_03115 [Patescibacteria group bacterium]